jgi:type IV pilus assembly protein PilB
MAKRLAQEGHISEEQARETQHKATLAHEPFVTTLVRTGVLEAAVIAESASQAFGIPLLDLDALDLSQVPVKQVSEKLIRKHHALPLFQRGKRLFVGLSDPINIQALDELKFHTGSTIETVLVEEDKLATVIEKSLSNFDAAEMAFGASDLENLETLDTQARQDEEEDVASPATEDAPVVRFVNKVLLDAIQKGASDIHFEPYERQYRVRLRQDGVLHELTAPPVGLGARLAARLKVMSRLDLAERRVPQDGRIKINLSQNRAVDFRVSTCPTLFGEKVVLRLLDPSSARIGIDALGYEAEQKRTFQETILKPYGMVLVTGPTGSGKTVSLYTALNILNTEDRNISTAEDPAEINLPGVNQVNVRPKIGLTFAACLRSFLRQDPDVLMVGEIRDLETAEIAIKAAQTGHMVLSTVHTKDAPQTLTRLLNMGVPAYNIASSVSLIVAQRLTRRLCQHCRVPADLPGEELRHEGFKEPELDTLRIFHANEKGCRHCTGGYKGRTGIFQVMPVTETLGQIIMRGGHAEEIDAQAEADGVIDLHEAGLNKVRAGLTSLAEINRVTVD